MNVVNLTQHNATVEQIKDGVFDLPDQLRQRLVELLTFPADYSRDDLEKAAQGIVSLVKEVDCFRTMIGGMPSFMPVLERALAKEGCAVGYARTERVSVDQVQADGSVRKVSVFQHAGMYWAQQAIHACIYCGRRNCVAFSHGESICG